MLLQSQNIPWPTRQQPNYSIHDHTTRVDVLRGIEAAGHLKWVGIYIEVRQTRFSNPPVQFGSDFRFFGLHNEWINGFNGATRLSSPSRPVCERKNLHWRSGYEIHHQSNWKGHDKINPEIVA